MLFQDVPLILTIQWFLILISSGIGLNLGWRTLAYEWDKEDKGKNEPKDELAIFLAFVLALEIFVFGAFLFELDLYQWGYY